MIFVTKFDGRREPFTKSKIIRTCLRMHATYAQARAIADKIEKEAYNGIPTKKILSMVFSYMKEFKPEIKYQIDLREAISLLRPKPDFEKFIGLLLKSQGYSVEQNLVIPGKCVEHEIDAVARKGKETLYVEVKHHMNHHAYTGLDVFLEANSTFEDLREGYKENKHSINFTRALVVCNTKISEHAKRYAECKGINYIAWKFPEGNSLEYIIEKEKLYPITILKNLDYKVENKLGDSGIVLLKQILELSLEDLERITNLPREKAKKLVEETRKVLNP
jgi:predicted RecB family endonuclease